MANLEEEAVWEAVYQVEKTDPVLGGQSGVTNKPLKNLANRDAFLLEKLNELIEREEKRYPLGYMLITRNPRNPNTYGYPGKWRREQDDFSLISTTNNSKLGEMRGENNPTLPVVEHHHSAQIESTDLGTKKSASSGDHTHSASSESAGAHVHTYSDMGRGQNYGGQHGHQGGDQKHIQKDHETLEAGGHAHSISLKKSGAHVHELVMGSHNHKIKILGTGIKAASIDVRGLCMKVAIWTRIS